MSGKSKTAHLGKNFKGIIDFTSVEDVHPPLQYILNKVFYDSLNDWSLVRVISSLLFCFASIFYVERKRIELETPNVINDFILILYRNIKKDSFK